MNGPWIAFWVKRFQRVKLLFISMYLFSLQRKINRKNILTECLEKKNGRTSMLTTSAAADDNDDDKKLKCKYVHFNQKYSLLPSIPRTTTLTAFIFKALVCLCPGFVPLPLVLMERFCVQFLEYFRIASTTLRERGNI